MEEKAKNTPKKKKKPWKPMAIAKVPLDPQQAVLSCCDQSERGEVSGDYQCQAHGYDPGGPCSAGTSATAS